ncbi:hypothetical protein DTO027B5_8854 [Paecilomyces variotii]|nr:hypothetical protein DTO027B3_8880 [Paecilomyces variotii]KAJ9327984.1 hypothetical protein DTO027B5_8854 [Paecilomyces variotii]
MVSELPSRFTIPRIRTEQKGVYEGPYCDWVILDAIAQGLLLIRRAIAGGSYWQKENARSPSDSSYCRWIRRQYQYK